jgi:hypothetical protein
MIVARRAAATLTRRTMLDFDPLIHELLEQPLTPGDAMLRLIDAHERARPDGDWRPYRAMAFDAEAARLARQWFPAVVADQPPVRVPVKGLFFGLFQPTVGRETVADFYLGGATRFELDGEFDWAAGPAYFPRLRYAQSPVLAQIYCLAYGSKDGLGNDAEASLCLGFVVFAARAMLAEADPVLLVAPGASVGVAVGWDSGSPLYIGALTEAGFTVRRAADAIAGIEKRRAAIEAMLRRMGIKK